MKFELHTTDNKVHKFTERTLSEGIEYARCYVLDNLAWIDYVVANPGTERANIVEVTARVHACAVCNGPNAYDPESGVCRECQDA